MQLLKPQQGKSRLAVESASQEVRVIELDRLIIAKRKELSDLDNTFLRSLTETGQRGNAEEQYWKQKIIALAQEVEGLESRRKTALVPLVEREKKIENDERALLERAGMVALRESEADSERQILEDRLDDVAEREQNALDYAKSLEIRAQNVSLKEADVESRQDALVRIVQQVSMDKKLSEEEIHTQKAILKGREVVLTRREADCAKKEAGFAAREAKILDQYRALQKAITETNLNVSPRLHSSKRPKP